MRCTHINRLPIAMDPGHAVVGGVSVGQCEQDAFPGLFVCYEHAPKDALALLARDAMRERDALAKRLRGAA